MGLVTGGFYFCNCSTQLQLNHCKAKLVNIKHHVCCTCMLVFVAELDSYIEINPNHCLLPLNPLHYSHYFQNYNQLPKADIFALGLTAYCAVSVSIIAA